MKFFKALLFIVKLVNLFGFRNKFQNKIIKNKLKLINNKYDNFNHQKNKVFITNDESKITWVEGEVTLDFKLYLNESISNIEEPQVQINYLYNLPNENNVLFNNNLDLLDNVQVKPTWDDGEVEWDFTKEVNESISKTNQKLMNQNGI